MEELEKLGIIRITFTPMKFYTKTSQCKVVLCPTVYYKESYSNYMNSKKVLDLLLTLFMNEDVVHKEYFMFLYKHIGNENCSYEKAFMNNHNTCVLNNVVCRKIVERIIPLNDHDYDSEYIEKNNYILNNVPVAFITFIGSGYNSGVKFSDFSSLDKLIELKVIDSKTISKDVDELIVRQITISNNYERKLKLLKKMDINIHELIKVLRVEYF